MCEMHNRVNERLGKPTFSCQLKDLDLRMSQITDDGCAQLASRLRSGALPALEYLWLQDIPASEAARAAVHEARPNLR